MFLGVFLYEGHAREITKVFLVADYIFINEVFLLRFKVNESPCSLLRQIFYPDKSRRSTEHLLRFLLATANSRSNHFRYFKVGK